MSRLLKTLFGIGLLAAGGVDTATAQCTYTSLSSGVAVTVSTTPTPASFNQASPYWTAVAVRPASGSDWNIEVDQNVGAAPNCVSGLLASSVRTTGVDLVVGDFNAGHDALAIYRPLLTRASGAGNATVEWDDGANALTVNGPIVTRTTDATDVIEVWDVFLTAGVGYTINFSRTGADAKALLFKSGAGAYWAGRNSAQLELTASGSYTPSATGYYGIVVINDNGASGSYNLSVGRCEVPTDLASGVAVSTNGLAERYYRWDQNDTFHMAVGVRGTADWNIEAYGDRTGSSWPVCNASQLAASALAAPSVDFIVGNFDTQIPDTSYFVRAHMNNDQGMGSAMVEWDGGGTINDIILTDPVNPTISRTTGPSDVLECWDVYLNSGSTYQIFFNTLGADLKLFLFAPSLTWGNRSNAILQRTGSAAAAPYNATNTGWHGLVVVNDNGLAGSYDLRIFSSGAVAVGDEGPPTTALQGLAPNPTRGSMRIRFSLQEAGSVAFDVLDVQGRVVSEIPARDWAAGRWSVGWNGRSRADRALGAGIYFIRMRVHGRTIGLRKFALLD